MPSTFIYLGILLLVICIWFILFKRPVYEAILVSFIILLTVTGTWKNVLNYIESGLTTSLIYSMIAFVAMSVILSKTKIIDGSVEIILSLLGRIPGGAGYAAVVASSFMGALSGSGPGNVMATGSITIPTMKRSGFPAELAANIESNASYLGNMIPPSSNIVAALGAFTALYPNANMTAGKFWIILWGVSAWFILEKLIMVFLFCKYYKIKPIPKEERPVLKEVFRKHWQGLLLPIIILLPFVFDYFFKDTFFTERLGATGAKYFSSSLLLFVAGIASLYAILIVKDKKSVTPHKIATMFANSIKSIAPAIGVCIIGYMISAMFADLNVAGDMEHFIISMKFSKFGMVMFISTLTCFLGMVIPGSSLVVIFGPVFISTLASVGVNPVLAAAMLPCICGVMCGITPPLALGLYAGMTLAESDFDKTVKNDLWWVFAHFVLEVIVLMGLLPIFGM
ncbi:MAG: TRAP transporter large permease subunit [Ruminococcaceae bacterium]|nr:TRAP transporter large permease subunit [Oscillospiraceae bacterium]